jgi:glutamine amidotransferase
LKIAVVDYGMGNLRSVAKALEHVAPEASVVVTAAPDAIRGAERVVVPGQGALPDCMRQLEASGAREAVVEATRAKPFLGICIGLQMLFEFSEEGHVAGLGLLPGAVRRFPAEAMVDGRGGRLKVPHMGWNQVRQARAHPLWEGIADGSRFYFVHSYYADPGQAEVVAGLSAYPFEFACAVGWGNLFAVQFHPEKSAASGLRLLANFAAWQPRVAVPAG